MFKRKFSAKLKERIRTRFFSQKLKFTSTGKYFAVLSFLIGAAAVNAGINLLFVVFAMMLSTMLVSGFLLESTTKKIRIKRHLPNTIHANDEFEVKLTIFNDKRKIPSFSLVFQDVVKSVTEFPKAYALKIPPKESVDLRYTCKFEKRGLYTFPHTLIISRFPFGFFVKSVQHPCKSDVIVFPEVKKINKANSMLSEFTLSKSRKEMLKDGSDIFHGIREFRHGDNPKWIHWRSTAKFQKVMLKEYEMEDLKRVLIILDTFIPLENENKLSDNLEEGIILAASFANFFKEAGCEVSFAAFTPDLTIIKAVRGKKELFDILLSLALLTPSKKNPVESLFSQVEKALFKNSFNISILLESDDIRKKNIRTLAREYGISRVIFINEGKHKRLYSREKSRVYFTK